MRGDEHRVVVDDQVVHVPDLRGEHGVILATRARRAQCRHRRDHDDGVAHRCDQRRSSVRSRSREVHRSPSRVVGLRSDEQIEEEFGDLLFAIVNLARHLDVDPEKALVLANRKFEARFRAMERAIEDRGEDFREHTLESLDKEWRAAKKRVG